MTRRELQVFCALSLLGLVLLGAFAPFGQGGAPFDAGALVVLALAGWLVALGRYARRLPIFRRLTLRRVDGAVYLDRWGVSTRIGGVYLHRMSAADPGVDIHDHPWPFVTVVLRGGYVERRAETRDPGRSHYEVRRPWRPRVMRLDEAHTITRLNAPRSWSLVFCGRRSRVWGFYEAHNFGSRYEWVESAAYAKPSRPLREERPS